MATSNAKLLQTQMCTALNICPHITVWHFQLYQRRTAILFPRDATETIQSVSFLGEEVLLLSNACTAPSIQVQDL